MQSDSSITTLSHPSSNNEMNSTTTVHQSPTTGDDQDQGAASLGEGETEGEIQQGHDHDDEFIRITAAHQILTEGKRDERCEMRDHHHRAFSFV